MIIDNITNIINIIINRKMFMYPFSPNFFILLTGKSSEIFSKRNEHGFISESFAMN